MAKSSNGRGVFYHRDSGGKHEMTPRQYIEWAKAKADEHGIEFRGSQEQFERMIKNGISAEGDIYLDYEVPGSELSRDGLDSLIKATKTDASITHLMIARRDRLARPQDPVDAMQIENDLRRNGVTIVFRDKVLSPLQRGRGADIAEAISSLVEYEEAGKFSRTHAQKMIDAQIALAKAGRSTGGRAPYGYRRNLVRDDGKVIRELEDGEIIRMAGHHSMWLPGPQEEIDIIKRILHLIADNPASKVAKTLTQEGVPTPNHGRTRKDNGVTHLTSGVWHANTVTNIARNPLNLALKVYGRRGMGKNLRYTPKGPRELVESDYTDDLIDKPKVVVNDEADLITAECPFDPIVDSEKHKQLVVELDRRGQSQRGKPRSLDPNNNPLGCRVYDMNCGSVMYRNPYNGSFKYKCGLYQQSHGAVCTSNGVDGPTATKFILGCIGQRVLSPSFLPKVESAIRKLAADASKDNNYQQEFQTKKSQLASVEAELATVGKNLARAESDRHHKIVAAEFDKLSERRDQLVSQIGDLERTQSKDAGEEDIALALSQAEQLVELASSSTDMSAASEIIRMTNAKLYLEFRPVKLTKRYVNKVASGITTFGSAPVPIKIYEGPTSREQLGKLAQAKKSSGKRKSQRQGQNCCSSDEERKSIGNVNRAERI